MTEEDVIDHRFYAAPSLGFCGEDETKATAEIDVWPGWCRHWSSRLIRTSGTGKQKSIAWWIEFGTVKEKDKGRGKGVATRREKGLSRSRSKSEATLWHRHAEWRCEAATRRRQTILDAIRRRQRTAERRRERTRRRKKEWETQKRFNSGDGILSDGSKMTTIDEREED